MMTLLHLMQSLLARLAPQGNPDDAYLAQAVDVADLEWRLRAIDERGRDPMSGIALGLYAR